MRCVSAVAELAERRRQRPTVKLIFPLVLFIFPGIFRCARRPCRDQDDQRTVHEDGTEKRAARREIAVASDGVKQYKTGRNAGKKRDWNPRCQTLRIVAMSTSMPSISQVRFHA